MFQQPVWKPSNDYRTENYVIALLSCRTIQKCTQITYLIRVFEGFGRSSLLNLSQNSLFLTKKSTHEYPKQPFESDIIEIMRVSTALVTQIFQSPVRCMPVCTILMLDLIIHIYQRKAKTILKTSFAPMSACSYLDKRTCL